ncbi:MAG TPA: YciI family protein [Gemmatimonadaceae bacterium]|nr:YciI family protein [Gemmatimonadaceae bacterium]
MRFMMLYKPGRESTSPPTQEEYARMGDLIEEMAKAGVLVATDGLQHSSKGCRVRISDGKFVVTDGPFTEAKELIAGYAIVNVESKARAIELAKRFLAVVGEGESEVRQMMDQDDPCAEFTAELKEQQERWRAEPAAQG